MSGNYPDWVILHIPHDSIMIPKDIADQYIISNDELYQELILMTDHSTRQLFAKDVKKDRIVYAQFSRLVVDVERFEDDGKEPMASHGMGVIYTKTANQKALRRPLSIDEREYLLDRFYRPYHDWFQSEVDKVLKKYGHCLVMDCHSFLSRPLPYEMKQSLRRPEICIGTDPFHTPKELEESFVKAFTDEGYSVSVNEPFSGAIVPMKHYKKDDRVKAIMIEVNRSLYVDERTGELLFTFPKFKKSLEKVIESALTKSY